MPYDRDRHHRRSVRLKHYDYSTAGVYFITICTHKRAPCFDDPVVREIATSAWQAIPEHNAGVTLDEWVVMPNHLHGLLELRGTGALSLRPADNMSPRSASLAVIIRTYKAVVTVACRKSGYEQFAWQTGFYDHVIRDHSELDRVRLYIRNNPDQWALDHENPEYKPPTR